MPLVRRNHFCFWFDALRMLFFSSFFFHLYFHLLFLFLVYFCFFRKRLSVYFTSQSIWPFSSIFSSSITFPHKRSVFLLLRGVFFLLLLYFRSLYLWLCVSLSHFEPDHKRLYNMSVKPSEYTMYSIHLIHEKRIDKKIMMIMRS